MKRLFITIALLILTANCYAVSAKYNPLLQDKARDAGGRIINISLLVIDQSILVNRLGATIPDGKMYVLRQDVVPLDHPYDKYGNDANTPIDKTKLTPGNVRLRSYKRPRPVTLRANVGDTLEIHLTNLMSTGSAKPIDCSDETSTEAANSCATIQVMGLDWLDNPDKKDKKDGNRNSLRIAPGEEQVYRFYANDEGVFMLYSPNGQSIPSSQLDYGLFGSVNVQPEEAEWYRSQVTHDDLKLANYQVSSRFMKQLWDRSDNRACRKYIPSTQTGLPQGLSLRRKNLYDADGLHCPVGGVDTVWQLQIPTRHGNTSITSEVTIDADGYIKTLAGQPLVNYQAIYPADHARAGIPVLNMLQQDSDNKYELVHTDLTAIITGPDAGRFPYYLNSPSFTENPAMPDRRQPYREFTVAYHIAPNVTQAFDEVFSKGPLSTMLSAGQDGFAINYGIAGIGPEIYANRANLGPMGFHQDGVDLLFEEFFLSSWAVGDPAMIVNNPANTGLRASVAYYPDDPSNVYHSYMRDHVKMRIMNTGSVAPHVHHQHAHQWLHSPNSDNGHYLDSQMINPGSTYTAEMTYNGSGNRNQTVGDSIFHCHIYPHFAQGMWSLWRVHDVFEEGTELEQSGMPKLGARALPDGEIARGTPIPAIVPLPSLAIAPMPAEVILSEDGRRIHVTPDGYSTNGDPIYSKNPGFPFFIPGVAGHRAPHPPMDFAWQENEDLTPALHTKTTATPFRKPGDIVYLDGGLPRHLVLGGELKREFHTRWDFTKDVSVMQAMELPEGGTPIELVAMQAHATRSHASYQPDGQPGNFILNGLPPVPGAPYAAPEVDDNGNSTANVRRYKAAVVQKDVVFNKEGWHYPQQRFITLLEDVKPTMDGIKPPEPFFFRANTGETIEFWHTNLVPNYYELDDFQVRTPTDILGQHIHLVKFDVTSSDGSGNGFNYEDGTFSPDEVRDRIKAINAAGGLYHFDSKKQFVAKQQSQLAVVPYSDAYGDTLGNPPAGQDWDGAQTTVQRFDTDPLLNNMGEDRTLRTVFTHDHFGPSTHQQVGLYGALLVEPAGSIWKDAVTGCPMPDTGECVKRNDGGPTSWQAVIETVDSDESYREFAFAMADLQLAYLPDSISQREKITTVWFSINEDQENIINALDKTKISPSLRDDFTAQGAILAADASVKVISPGEQWELKPNSADKFELTLNGKSIDVKTLTLEASWSDPQQAIWAPTGTGGAPYPTVISDPGGSGNIGAWVTNYRNEPLDVRITDAKGEQSSGDAGDPAFAYASIERGGRARLNSQPVGGAKIGSSKFRYPEQALVPEGENGVQATDPYTPLARAYANDKVQIRGIVGAVDSIHSLRIQGMKWLAQPSYDNSGFRDTQGMGISEHFELNFQLPAAAKDSAAPDFVDYLYAPSTSTQGQAKGAWGIMRAYREPVDKLVALPQNKTTKQQRADGFYTIPDGASRRSYDISIHYSKAKDILYYKVDGKRHNPLVLRANAGDWLTITLTNKVHPDQIDDKLSTQWGENDKNKSGSASYDGIQDYQASLQAGLNPMLLAYDSSNSAGINIGFNTAQTVKPGESRTYTWYVGDIHLDEDGKQQLTPIEFGAINLTPADPLLQPSYGAYAVLAVQPTGATWDKKHQHNLSLKINGAKGDHLYTEIVVVDNHAASKTKVKAGKEVRFRILNSSAGGSPGNTSDGVNMITIEGHGWPEEPYAKGSTIIAQNPQAQWMGTQQVTPLESYNLLLPSAGGDKKVTGNYDFYYYPKGPDVKLGTLKVE